MEGIRDEDRGHRTRVFRITSVKLGIKLEICIGLKYEEDDHDRYNVYRVSNGAVGALIGHYDIKKDEVVEDESGDFDVSRYGEPTWTAVNLIKREPKPDREKPEPEPKPDRIEPKPKPKKDTMFKVITTTVNGDCFYDTVVRALHDLNEYKVEEINKLREEISNYIVSERGDDLVERYKLCIGSNTLRDDSYYAKYWDMCLDDERAIKIRTENGKNKMSFEEVKELVIEEINQNPELKKKINPDLFKEDTDLKQKAPNDILSEDCEFFINDYFKGDQTIEDDFELLDIYSKSLMTSNVWADAFSITSLEMMMNIKIIPLIPNGKRVEDYTASLEASPDVPNEKTRFILADYEPRTHYKLIELIPNKRLFTFDELPDVIKDKCKHLAWFIAMKRRENIDEARRVNPDIHSSEIPFPKPEEPAPEPEPDLPEPVLPEPKQNIDGMTLAELKAYAKEKNLKFNSDVKSKADLIKCIKEPELADCLPKRKTKKGGVKGTKFTRRN